MKCTHCGRYYRCFNEACVHFKDKEYKCVCDDCGRISKGLCKIAPWDPILPPKRLKGKLIGEWRPQ